MPSGALVAGPPATHEASGVIHCHTTYSDGTHSFAEVCQSADRAGLDFLIMTDHDNMDACQDHGEQHWGRTLVLIGVEITPRHNHYLAYGIAGFPSRNLPPAQYVAAIRSQGGIGFCAHPFEDGSRVLRMKEYGWRDWAVTGCDGLEIWNYFSSWVSGCTSWTRAIRAALLGNWPLVAGDPDRRTLRKWDELGQQRRVAGIGGVDAHGVRIRLLGLFTVTLHPFARAFRTVRTHLLLSEPMRGDVDHDRALLVAALRNGRAYIANWERGDPSGFRFAAHTTSGWLEMGDETRLPGRNGTVTFTIALRCDEPMGEIRLLKDGSLLAAANGPELQAPDAGPGVYRVEVRRRGRGWIYANPIYLR